MCLFHYSVSVTASVGATDTVSAVLAAWSSVQKRKGEGFFADLHLRGADTAEADMGDARWQNLLS